jgi:tetratricopeptide (TPR) repeat protein
MSFSQSTDEKLAHQFYENGEYEKAIDIYKKSFKHSRTNTQVYEEYLQSLLAINNQKGAETMIKKQIKSFPQSYFYQVDLGYVYDHFKLESDADKLYSSLIKKVSTSRSSVYGLAQAFSKRQLHDQAIETFERGAKNLGIMEFWTSLAPYYRMRQNYKDLAGLCLEVLKESPDQLNRVFSYFDNLLENEEQSDYLQQLTLTYIQKNPEISVFDDLLFKVYTQLNKYNAAYRQIVAMDKRKFAEGGLVMSFAEMCIEAKQYDYAIKSFEYVLNLGIDGGYYKNAQVGLLDASFLQLSSSFSPKQEDIDALETRFNTYFGSSKLDYTNALVAKRLAELSIYYLNDGRRGVEQLESVVELPRLQPVFKGECKLLLGDAYLMLNSIWDAKLIYGQVDKEFKEDVLGQEAKYRNARLSYFTGDFEWAKSQLDVLKTATTQLISNNAIELSLLLQDNTGLDSNTAAMEEYSLAEFYLFQNNIIKCSEILNMIPFKYPNHQLQDEVYFLQAKLEQRKGDYTLAKALYKKVYENHADDILADNALFYAAEIELFGLENSDTAMALYEELLVNYPSSLYVVEARKKFYALREGKTKEELFFEGSIN